MALLIKKLPANAGDQRGAGRFPGLGRSPEGGHGNPLQYSCLEKPMDKGAWRALIHRVTRSQTQLNRQHSIVKRKKKEKMLSLGSINKK